MKFIKVDDELINLNSIWKITMDDEETARLHLIKEGDYILISKDTLDKYLQYAGYETLEIERTESKGAGVF